MSKRTLVFALVVIAIGVSTKLAIEWISGLLGVSDVNATIPTLVGIAIVWIAYLGQWNKPAGQEKDSD